MTDLSINAGDQYSALAITHGLSTILDARSRHDRGISYTIPDHWRQGRTTYGGLTAGLSLASAIHTLENDPTHKQPPTLDMLRSAMISFVGPVSGNPVCITKPMRRGRNVTSAYVETLVDDTIVANASLFFGSARASEVAHSVNCPSNPAPETCEEFTPQEAKAIVPNFFHNFETRLIDGGRPLSGAAEAYIRCWSRHIDPGARTGMTAFLTLADVLPAAALVTSSRFAPISTMSWLINILEEPHTDDGWFQIEVRQSAAAGGYSSQSMRFWNRDGALIAEALQSIAVFF